ncbi:hypothetical protein BJV82DRAFT_670831 [Fennellomyces sp. T-0311]|nr:hypothetical protein BJV82DRAFT_670831 [Fennellomyces sp. T-0311]
MLNKAEFLAINSLIMALSGLSAIGASILWVRDVKRRKAYYALVFAAAVLIVQEGLILAIHSQPRLGAAFVVHEFFYYISSPLVWSTLFDLVGQSAIPRLVKNGWSRGCFFGWFLIYAGFLWTLTMFCYAIFYAKDNAPFGFLLYGMAGYIVLFLAVVVVHFKDIRPLGWTFALFSFFLLCSAVGSVVLGAGYSVGDYNPLIVADEYIRTIAVILSTATGLLIAVISYPTVWIRHINKNQSTDEFSSPSFQHEVEINAGDDEPMFWTLAHPKLNANNGYDGCRWHYRMKKSTLKWLISTLSTFEAFAWDSAQMILVYVQVCCAV